jgi:hypothetical protein
MNWTVPLASVAGPLVDGSLSENTSPPGVLAVACWACAGMAHEAANEMASAHSQAAAGRAAADHGNRQNGMLPPVTRRCRCRDGH